MSQVERMEDLVRETLAAHQAQAPDGTGLLDAVAQGTARRRRRGWLAVGAAAAAVTALIAGVVTVTSAGRPVTGALAPTGPGVPADAQAVTVHGVEVFVPATWKINKTRCGTPTEDTVIFDDGSAITSCAVRQPPGLTVVRLDSADGYPGRLRSAVATQPVTVDGHSGRRGSGTPAGTHTRLAVLVLPDSNMVVSVESPDPAVARRILDSTRVVG